MGVGANLWPQKLDFSISEMELTHLVKDKTLGVVYLATDQQHQPAFIDGPRQMPHQVQQPLQGHLCPVLLSFSQAALLLSFLLNVKGSHKTYNQESYGV